MFTPNKVKVGFYQFNPAFGEKQRNIEKVVCKLSNIASSLIVLPELFATGYQFISSEEVHCLAEKIPEGPTTKALIEIAQKKDLFIVAGIAEESNGKVYNSAVLVGPDGFIGLYRKIHLFYEEKLYFEPGDCGFKVFDTDVGKIGIMICFDWFFPESMRTLALKGAQIVCHPANLVLPYCPNSMPVRCLENRVFAITANRIGKEARVPGKSLNYIGLSEIVSPEGQILARAPEDKESLILLEIAPQLALQKSINKFNDLFKDRRSEFYYQF